jgi:decaprenylphospho-beta-D-ribofuranose 2-oxidase
MNYSVERTGWGRAMKSKSRIVDSLNILEELKHLPSNGILPVGLSRSYGDSALNSEGLCVTTQNEKKIFIDAATGIATCESGATIGQLEKAALTHGYFPYVVPGTEFVTIGGAIASDIHGKSHHLHGSFGNHVIEISIVLASGEEITVSPKGPFAGYFSATVGGMGLTGLIKSAKIQLRKVESAYVKLKNKRVENLKEMLSTLRDFEDDFEYCVAWVDFSGKFEGRGIVTGGNHANVNELPSRLQAKHFAEHEPRSIKLSELIEPRIINKVTVRLFNKFWYRKPLGANFAHLRPFMHPLDGIVNWNRLYGKTGFLQYQFVIPFENEEFIFQVLEKLRRIGAGSPLAVLKGFGDQSNGLLSFPKNGWTLALDISTESKDLFQVLDSLDADLVKLGGRVYLTKDSRMKGDQLTQMYPNLDKWRGIKNDMDPKNVWQSDQSRRLKLC